MAVNHFLDIEVEVNEDEDKDEEDEEYGRGVTVPFEFIGKQQAWWGWCRVQ